MASGLTKKLASSMQLESSKSASQLSDKKWKAYQADGSMRVSPSRKVSHSQRNARQCIDIRRQTTPTPLPTSVKPPPAALTPT